jgi:hypothetical protein
MEIGRFLLNIIHKVNPTPEIPLLSPELQPFCPNEAEIPSHANIIQN